VSLQETQTIRAQQRQINRLESEKAELENRVRQLESTLYKTRLTFESMSAGAGEAVKKAVELADQDRQKYETRIAELEKRNQAVAEEYLPMRTISTAFDPRLPTGVKLNNTAVGCTLWFSSGQEAEYLKLEDIFEGSIHEAKQEVIQAVIIAMGRLPTHGDLAAQKDYPGLSKEELLNVCERLVRFRYWLKDEYKDQRAEIFEGLWPRISQAIDKLPTGRQMDKNEAHTRFNHIIDRTFKYADARREEIRIVEISNQSS